MLREGPVAIHYFSCRAGAPVMLSILLLFSVAFSSITHHLSHKNVLVTSCCEIAVGTVLLEVVLALCARVGFVLRLHLAPSLWETKQISLNC
uniref:Uncharacterized protein n=1 Tax=Amblyomma cajennense TaxID=34607 RepID=A0A023FBH9_AMBCJ